MRKKNIKVRFIVKILYKGKEIFCNSQSFALTLHIRFKSLGKNDIFYYCLGCLGCRVSFLW